MPKKNSFDGTFVCLYPLTKEVRTHRTRENPRPVEDAELMQNINSVVGSRDILKADRVVFIFDNGRAVVVKHRGG